MATAVRVNARYVNVSFPVSFLPVVDVGVSDAFGLVTGELLYVLRGPAFVYRPLFLAQPGDQFPLLGRDVSASWYYVALGNGLTGWIPVTSPLLPSVPIRDLPIAAPFVNSDVFGLRDHYQLYTGPDYAFQTQSELIAGQQLMDRRPQRGWLVAAGAAAGRHRRVGGCGRRQHAAAYQHTAGSQRNAAAGGDNALAYRHQRTSSYP